MASGAPVAEGACHLGRRSPSDCVAQGASASGYVVGDGDGDMTTWRSGYPTIEEIDIGIRRTWPERLMRELNLVDRQVTSYEKRILLLIESCRCSCQMRPSG